MIKQKKLTAENRRKGVNAELSLRNLCVLFFSAVKKNLDKMIF